MGHTTSLTYSLVYISCYLIARFLFAPINLGTEAKKAIQEVELKKVLFTDPDNGF